MKLDINQEKIAKDFEGQIAVVAGPGSGKTRTLIERCSYMFDSGINPNSILLISYTNKIRAEIKNRLQSRDENLEKINVHTFHSFGIFLLRKYGIYVKINSNFSVIDDTDIKTVLNRVYTELELSKSEYPIKKVQKDLEKIYSEKASLFSDSREFVEYLNSIQKTTESNIINTIFNYFTYYKKQNNYLDFDDILYYTNALLYTPEANNVLKSFKYVMVDEAQDLNSTQYEFIALLKKNNISNILLVGDFDQNIYSWRGAKADLFLKFYNSNDTKKYELSINYRSSQKIVKSSKKLIEHNKNRIPINLTSNNIDDSIIEYKFLDSSYEEAMWVAQKIKKLISNGESPSEIAILYRANYLSRNYESELIKQNIKYIIYNGFDFYSRIEIKDTIALLKILVNPSDRLSWERILLNTPGIGPKKMSRILESDFSSLSLKDKQLLDNYNSYFEYAKKLPNIEAKLTYLIDSFKYKEMWDDGNLDDRLENYSELLRYISTFDDENLSLEEFLDNISLLTKQDEHKNINECIKLMTLHSSKGLEFKYVFIVSAVDGILPNERSISENLLEEERRLMYVGMTRAKQYLYITVAPFYGYSNSYFYPSRFIKEAGILKENNGKLSDDNTIVIDFDKMYNNYIETNTKHKINKISNNKRDNLYIELILTIFTGFWGGHYIYKRQYTKFLLYLFTMAFFGIGYVIDVIRVLSKILSSF